MARIQILQLPPYGADGVQPFALIVDQCETPPQRVGIGLPTDPPPLPGGQARPYEVPPTVFTDEWLEFGKLIGAAGVLVTQERVDIVDGTADQDADLLEFDTAVLGQSVAEAMRFHLESPEASDALRAWYERRRAAGGQPTVENHIHFQPPSVDSKALQRLINASEARRRGDGGVGGMFR